MPDIATAPENDVDKPLPGGRGEVVTPESAERGQAGTVEFISKSTALRLVYAPAWEDWERGRIVRKEAEEAVEFENGRYVCYPPDHKKGKFSDGTPIVEWLRGHENLDREFAGFIEVTPIPPAPSGDELQQITLAALAHDEDKLSAMWQEERDGHNRREILEPIEAALDALKALNEAQKK